MHCFKTDASFEAHPENLNEDAHPSDSYSFWQYTVHVDTASNEASRHAELVNVQTWADRNNLRLNSKKSSEVIFTDSRRRRRHAAEPAQIPEITRSRSLKMLGVDIASDFSVSQHVQRLVTN